MYIQKYVDFHTSRIFTDSAKQYVGVEKIFSTETVHLTTNHSKGEFVSSTNPENTINDLENENKLLKKQIICRNTTKLLQQYMALLFYRRNCLEKHYDDSGSQIMQFLLDVKKVYPGVVNGELQEGLSLKEIDEPNTVCPPKDDDDNIDFCLENTSLNDENDENDDNSTMF